MITRMTITVLLLCFALPAGGGEYVMGVQDRHLKVDNPALFYAHRDRLKQRYEMSRRLRFERHWTRYSSHCSPRRSDLYRMTPPYPNDYVYDEGYPE